MNSELPGDPSGGWLAATVRNLLVAKYGPERVPGVRQISADIRTATGGQTISHGHLHNILVGNAQNLTEHTRAILARFFGKPPSYFSPPAAPGGPDSVQALAARFATFDRAQVEAIRQAVEIVTAQTEQKD